MKSTQSNLPPSYDFDPVSKPPMNAHFSARAIRAIYVRYALYVHYTCATHERPKLGKCVRSLA